MRGHLRERSKGTWELRVYLGRDPVTRRDRYRTKTFKGGKRAAQEALAGFVAQAGACRRRGRGRRWLCCV